MVPIRILLVDDETDFVNHVVRYLRESAEFQVVATADTRAVDLLQAQILSLEVNVVALAFSMPNHIEIVRQLRVACPRLGIVVLASQADSDLCAMVIQAGADSFLARALLDVGLLASIRQVVHWHRRRPGISVAL